MKLKLSEGLLAVAAGGLFSFTLVAEGVRCVNYDESKAGPYVLEDLLTFADGRKLASPEEWPARRREILDILQREEYGRWPEKLETLVVDKTEESEQYFGLAVRRQYSMWFKADRTGPRIDWMLVMPAQRTGPVPVVVMLNNKGNHELFADAGVSVHDAWVPHRHAKGKDPHRLDDSRRGALRWPLETVVARGYAVLMACYSQAAPDPDAGEMTVADCHSRGCYQLWKDAGDIGTLNVWGWALCRGLDLAERLEELDATRSVAFGCSRLAKAALLAGAFDDRFKVVVPCQCGCGGPALLKRNFGENVDWMNKEFQHWFCAKFLTYANNERAMPFDQHFLVAAVAPRHLLVEGFDEPWYDTKGEWLSCREASPVWNFLGKPGMPGGDWPADFSKDAVGTHLGYVRRPGTHGISAHDWTWMLDFADAAFVLAEPVPAEAPPAVVKDFEYRRNPNLKGKKAFFYIDDVIWVFRDLARQRPKSLFDNAFLKLLREAHERYDMKIQLNCFYRTDFFYGTDEFTLAEMPDAYKAEWQANKDWLRLGFHSLQEFPDYPFVNLDYADARKVIGGIRREIDRFAGEGVFARGAVTHWGVASKGTCRAAADEGVKLLIAHCGPRRAWDGKEEALPYGHSWRLLNNRKPETALFTRYGAGDDISASVSGYNHFTMEMGWRMFGNFEYVYDRETRLGLKELEDLQQIGAINIYEVEELPRMFKKVIGNELVTFGDHEQYFYKDYFHYQPNYAEKIFTCGKMLQDAGYGFFFIEELVAE